MTTREAARTTGARGRLRIGISGWRYAPWRGVFYPKELPHRRELEYASRCFDTIEVNGSFYSLQSPQSWQRWHDDTPADFVFAVKAPRYITHLRRLRDVQAPLANFFASGVLLLGRKLGPLLWQFPPNLRFDAPRWSAFLALLPRTHEAALRCARGHDGRIRDPALPAVLPRRRLRHAVEVRHESFCSDEFVTLLRRHAVALVVADTAGKWPLVEDVTSDFMYLRLHGAEELYTSRYGDRALRHWARRIARWASGGEPDDARRISSQRPRDARSRAVYCYFDNDAKVEAPFDAQRLRRMLDAGEGGNFHQ